LSHGTFHMPIHLLNGCNARNTLVQNGIPAIAMDEMDKKGSITV